MPTRKENQHTAGYRTHIENGGYAFTFFCAVSGGAVCRTECVQAGSEADALRLAWEKQACSRFNRCRKCGAWVSDMMYNADTLKCVECSPWEDKPAFCSACGTKVEADEVFCKKCGVRLQYGGEDA